MNRNAYGRKGNFDLSANAVLITSAHNIYITITWNTILELFVKLQYNDYENNDKEIMLNSNTKS